MRRALWRAGPVALAPLVAAALAGCAPIRAARAVARGAEPPARADEAPVEVRTDLPYQEGASAHARHRLDVYLPQGRKGFPVLLFWHGGAWKFGSKDMYGPMGRRFAAQGIALAVANYRLSPEVKHPEHVRDAARAVAWVARHAAEWGADAKRLYVMGHSAGAHMATLLATDPRYLKEHGLAPERLAGVIGVSGPYVFAGNSLADVFGTNPRERRDAWPLSHVTDLPAAKLPSFLLLYAEQDYAGLPLAARALLGALERHGARAQAHEISGRDHVNIIIGAGRPEDPLTRHVSAFLNGR
jgi:acetyl esterase/lipase